MKQDDLGKIIYKEDNYWSAIFKKELEKDDRKKQFTSEWWKQYYQQISNTLTPILFDNNVKKILEAGSGSGKATIVLDTSFKKTLLDISPEALKFAKYVASKFNNRNINYVEGNVFSMPFLDKSFDLTWNIGVIEHYRLNDIQQIIKEMIRVTSASGIVAVGLPNKYSGPITKASFLKLRIFKSVSGYRLGSEKFYSTKKLFKMFNETAEKTDRRIMWIKVFYFGNPLPMETPKLILNTIGVVLNILLRKNRFLKLIVIKLTGG